MTSYGGYDAFDDPYAYKRSVVLKNRLGLRSADLLESFELEMTAIRASEPLPYGTFDAAHYRRIHRHLFRDVYSWAGKYRTVRTAKGGNPFCFPEHIVVSMNRLFATLPTTLAAETPDAFVNAIAAFLAELNAIHPFREGNGRSQLAFIDLVGRRAGFDFDFSRVGRDTFLPAMVASYDQELDPLVAELRNLLK